MLSSVTHSVKGSCHMSRYLPAILGVLVIVGLTIPQIRMSDRFAGSNFSAEQRAKLLEKVPKDFGDWHGEDLEITDEVRKGAGVVGAAVSRSYRNARSGDEVKLWLIVGHAREISAHTPDICYPASGLMPKASENSLHSIVYPGQSTDAPFWTNTFIKEDILTGRQLIRVFWAWYNPKSHDKVTWEAPSNARWWFGNTRALYKMYFTSVMRDPSETTEQSACMRFAREFMPIVEKVLSDFQTGETTDTTNTTAAEPGTSSGSEAKLDDSALTTPETTSAEASAPAAESATPAAEPTPTEPAAGSDTQ
jgi:Protein of unknown function (DUF3485)